MISTSLRVFLTTGLLLYFLLIFSLLKRKTLSLKYTLLWIFGGIGMGILLIFPELLNWFIHIVGIQLASNGLFAMILFFVLIILISITSIVSNQSDTIKRLVQDNALLEKRIRELEGKVWAENITGTESIIEPENKV
ncbi:DUF2304 domain-containing protein [Anaerocolumna sp. AGMB13025]|uniref:DUF2304 domain-containing protein n=1 Tax=Anaerocolumna sp. AGMB13025 TaxID=3039116 RepID=UPI00241EB012|nr:DUF2304 domain-containing protein [Anaerocolumna sp. AGMB13025]WFR56255.1 DUF2304 domain-containing protein [Anaerocolumna sp. AGMB13025]